MKENIVLDLPFNFDDLLDETQRAQHCVYNGFIGSFRRQTLDAAQKLN
jgi:hypothetical protein